MPLFGKKKDKQIDMPEVVDFSNDTWSFKGEAPVYQIQSDGFSYDVTDADGNDKNAISLGLAGMLIIVLNAKSPKIREDELLPEFGKVIKTRNWHAMTVKEANSLVQIAIKKLSSSSLSGDVFDLASYAPLEVKRVLLKSLFTISRTRMKPEFREEAEHRIIDDIVPEIFSNPEYELALLTGLIIKSDNKPADPVSNKIETSPVIDPDEYNYNRSSSDDSSYQPTTGPALEEDSAFAELQKIYGRKTDTPRFTPDAVQQAEPAADRTENAEPSAERLSIPAFSTPQPISEPAPQEVKKTPEPPAQPFAPAQPNNPFAQSEPKNVPQPVAPNFSVPQPNNPFARQDPGNIPFPAAPNFSVPQPGNPFAPSEGAVQFQQMNGIPQPPVPNFGMQQNNPYGNMPQQGNMPMQFSQGMYAAGNIPPYPGQMRQQNSPVTQQPNPGQAWQQNVQRIAQNLNANPQNPAQFNPDPQAGQGNPARMNRGPYPWPAPQQPQDPRTSENA